MSVGSKGVFYNWTYFPRVICSDVSPLLASLYPFPILFSPLWFFVHCSATATFSCLLMTFSSSLALLLSYPISLPLPQFIFLCPSIISLLFLSSSNLILLLWRVRTQVSGIEVTLLFFLFNYFFPSSSLSSLAVLLKKLFLNWSY